MTSYTLVLRNVARVNGRKVDGTTIGVIGVRLDDRDNVASVTLTDANGSQCLTAIPTLRQAKQARRMILNEWPDTVARLYRNVMTEVR